MKCCPPVQILPEETDLRARFGVEWSWYTGSQRTVCPGNRETVSPIGREREHHQGSLGPVRPAHKKG